MSPEFPEFYSSINFVDACGKIGQLAYQLGFLNRDFGMPAAEYTEQDVRAFIKSTVAEHWTSEPSKGTAILLSVLGGLVKEKFPEFHVVIGSGLKAYLSAEDIARPVTYPGVTEKIGLIPVEAPLPEDLRELFPKRTTPASSATKPSYKQEFWNAFFRDIDLYRYVKLPGEGKVEILDVEGPQTGDGVYEITKDDLVDLPFGATIQDKADATRSKIDLWLTKHGLNGSTFLRTEYDFSNARHISSKVQALRATFGELSLADQARIMIPLDILLKLVK